MAAPVDVDFGEDFPSEIRERVAAFDRQLAQVEEDVRNFTGTPLADVHENVSLKPVDESAVCAETCGLSLLRFLLLGTQHGLDMNLAGD